MRDVDEVAGSEPTTWFGVITARGRLLATVAVALLVVAVTVLSALFPAAAPWLTISGGIVALFWYSRMMTVYRDVNKRHRV